MEFNYTKYDAWMFLQPNPPLDPHMHPLGHGAILNILTVISPFHVCLLVYESISKRKGPTASNRQEALL